MSKTLYLRFPDRATFMATLPDGFVMAGETGSPLPKGVEAISVVGSIHSDGVYDERGNTLVAPAAQPGFHVNVLGTLPPEWTAFQIFPDTPQRVFG